MKYFGFMFAEGTGTAWQQDEYLLPSFSFYVIFKEQKKKRQNLIDHPILHGSFYVYCCGAYSSSLHYKKIRGASSAATVSTLVCR